MVEQRWAWRLAALQLIHVAGWGAYYALTRMIYRGDEYFLLALAAAETLPTAAGLLGARIAEERGYRPVLALGIAEGLALAAAGLSLGSSRVLLWAAVFLASMFWSIAGPQVYAFTLTLSGGRAGPLGVVTAGATLGFSVGGGLAPLAAQLLSPRLILAAAGLGVAASYAALLCPAEGKRPRRGAGPSAGRTRLAALVAALYASTYVATETIGSVYLSKLARELSPELYSLANAGAGLVSAAARPLAGRMVDAVGPLVAPAVLAAYMVYLLALDRAHGVVLLVLWLIPLYPFLDLSLYTVSARLLGESLGLALSSSAYSAAGAVLLLASRLHAQPEALALTGLALAAALSAAAAAARNNRRKPSARAL